MRHSAYTGDVTLSAVDGPHEIHPLHPLRTRQSTVIRFWTFPPILLRSCLAVSTIIQLGLAWWAITGAGAWINALFCTMAIVTVGLGWAVVLRHWNTEHGRTAPLISWLHQIDVAGDNPPPPLHARADANLAAAVEHVVGQLRTYREKLLVRHQRIQRLMRSVTDVLYHTDRDGRITWITDTAEEMLGYTAADLEGRSLRHLLADPVDDYERLIYSPRLTREPIRCHRRDGSIAWLLISCRRIDDSDGHAIGSEGVCRDGTRLIETQRTLDEVMERAQVTLSSIGDGVVTTDARPDRLHESARRTDVGHDTTTGLGPGLRESLPVHRLGRHAIAA